MFSKTTDIERSRGGLMLYQIERWRLFGIVIFTRRVRVG
jgi:hypothetical protein